MLIPNFSVRGRSNSDKKETGIQAAEFSSTYQIYKKGTIIQKYTLIRGVFKDNLVWGEGIFRTAFIDPTFYDNVLKIKEKGLLFYEQPSQILA